MYVYCYSVKAARKSRFYKSARAFRFRNNVRLAAVLPVSAADIAVRAVKRYREQIFNRQVFVPRLISLSVRLRSIFSNPSSMYLCAFSSSSRFFGEYENSIFIFQAPPQHKIAAERWFLCHWASAFLSLQISDSSFPSVLVLMTFSARASVKKSNMIMPNGLSGR